MLATQLVCDSASHEEMKTDPAGYGLLSLGAGCGGTFYECPHCPSTLFIAGPLCDRCADTGEVETSDGIRSYSRLVKCDCGATSPLSEKIRRLREETDATMAALAAWVL